VVSQPLWDGAGEPSHKGWETTSNRSVIDLGDARADAPVAPQLILELHDAAHASIAMIAMLIHRHCDSACG